MLSPVSRCAPRCACAAYPGERSEQQRINTWNGAEGGALGEPGARRLCVRVLRVPAKRLGALPRALPPRDRDHVWTVPRSGAPHAVARRRRTPATRRTSPQTCSGCPCARRALRRCPRAQHTPVAPQHRSPPQAHPGPSPATAPPKPALPPTPPAHSQHPAPATQDRADQMSARGQPPPGARQRLFHVCLTGGPCSGKSSSLASFTSALTSRGVDVYALPEARLPGCHVTRPLSESAVRSRTRSNALRRAAAAGADYSHERRLPIPRPGRLRGGAHGRPSDPPSVPAGLRAAWDVGGRAGRRRRHARCAASAAARRSC